MNSFVTREEFQQAIEECCQQEPNRIVRFRVLRILRNRWKFERAYTAVLQEYNGGLLVAGALPLVGVDWQQILDWFMENWDEILKILLTVLPLLI